MDVVRAFTNRIWHATIAVHGHGDACRRPDVENTHGGATPAPATAQSVASSSAPAGRPRSRRAFSNRVRDVSLGEMRGHETE